MFFQSSQAIGCDNLQSSRWIRWIKGASLGQKTNVAEGRSAVGGGHYWQRTLGELVLFQMKYEITFCGGTIVWLCSFLFV